MIPAFEPGQHVIVEEFRGKIVAGEFYLLRIKHINVIEIRRIYCENGLCIITCDNPVKEVKLLDTELLEIPDDMDMGRVIYWGKRGWLKAKK